MLFNSFEYLIFLPLITLLFFIISPKNRWILLLLGSYYFYMSWKPEFAILILFCTAVNYLAAILIDKTQNKKLKTFLLVTALVLSFGVLVVYKYLGFLTSSVNSLLGVFTNSVSIPTFELLLPVGISFFTFQTLSYTIDVYRGKTPVEHHFGIFALFVSFFPQLVAGPIERSENLLPQFRKLQRFDIARTMSGLRIILWGLFKKVVIADRLAPIVDTVYNNIGNYDGFAFIIATVCFAFQIFCDFSGYSDIAVGSARILGFDLMQNFNRPYFSKSTGEFWRRWHISLSSWFRDYVYIPLGGNRKGRARYYFNTILTNAASGLWHGADWSFVIWGMINGVYVSLSHAFKGFRTKACAVFHLGNHPKLHKTIQVIITFTLICFSWIFFRANTIHDAFYVITHILPESFSPSAFVESASSITSSFHALSAFASVVVLELVHFFQRNNNPIRRLFDNSRIVRYLCYLFLFAAILTFGVTGNETAFIYFQF